MGKHQTQRASTATATAAEAATCVEVGGMTARAAVVGLGRAGSGWDEWAEGDTPPRTHAGCYQRSNRTELVAVCDVDSARATECATRRGLERSYSSLDFMLRNEVIDVLSVCTPPEQHLPVVRAAVEKEVPVVLCEKPLAGTLEDACEIVGLAEESNTTIAVMHHRRWMLGLDIARRLIEGADRVTAVIEYYGGMLNNGTHGIDLVRAVGVEMMPGGSRSGLMTDSGGNVVIADVGEFCVTVISDDFDISFGDGGRRLGIRQAGGNPTRASVFTDYPNARLRAIEQMADIYEIGGEPNCTVYDGLRAVELAHMALGRQEVAA